MRENMNVNEQFSEMKRGVIELISEAELKAKLSLGRPLRVKFGADPSAPDLTLGHCVQLRALRKMQELGHQVVFIIGDFTAMIGDPSGRSVTRPQLSREQVRDNAETYVSQAGKVLDMSKAEVKFNSEWLDKLTPYEMIKLAGKFTVAQLLEREDFAKRFKEQAPIGIHELFYPLMQGYDSYAVEADIEFGGTDQTFNLMMGREVQGLYGMKEQVVITRPLIPGTDGTKKMSKSLGNYIAVLDAPQEMFGKVMSLPDHLIAMYFEYLTDLPMSEIDEMAKAMKSGELNPRNVKDKLAQEIVTTMYDAEVGRGVSEEFRRTFSGRTQTLDDFRSAAEDIELAAEIIGTSVSLAKLMQEAGMTSSSGEARRLIQQGAVYINNDKITDPQALIIPVVNMIIRAGKRRIINIISK
jgi:tyrosyl-tRNA synthetase